MPLSNASVDLSTDEARLIALRGQGLAGDHEGRDVPAVLRQVGAVQLDTISVLARSHELVAYARLGPVGRKTVEEAYWGQPVQTFEYTGHAGCIFPLEMWPYFAFRRRAANRRFAERVSDTSKANADRWRAAAATFDEIRARLGEGPVTASDLGGARDGVGWWNWSAAKSGIELLYRLGEVVCTTRKSWKRIYDLPERAVPQDLLKNDPSDEECFIYLVRRAAQALGVGTRRDLAAYFGLTTTWLGTPSNARRLLDTAIEASGLIPVKIEGWKEMAFLDPAALAPAYSSQEHRATLLSPFDSLIWRGPIPPEGERTQRLFGFSVPFEPYIPKERRVHGYFSMALLAGGTLVGHVDPAREGRTLVARAVCLNDASAIDAMATALREAASWVGCDAVRIDQVDPPGIADALRQAVS